MKNLLTLIILLIAINQLYGQGSIDCSTATIALDRLDGNNICNHSGNVDQWFKYTATVDGKITISNCGVSQDTKIEIYSSCGSQIPIIANDNYCGKQSEVVFKCKTGITYYIKWKLIKGYEIYIWELIEHDALQGDFCNNPKNAILGSNISNHIGSGEQWFTYTTTRSGKLKISSCDKTNEDTYIEVYKSCTGYPIAYNNDHCSKQSSVILECTANTKYLIRWKNKSISNSYEWDLSYIIPQQGDFCKNPLNASIGANQSNHSSGNDQWFTYTATVTGEIIISSCNQTHENTFVEIYSDCNNQIIFNDDFCANQSQLSFACIKDETYLIKWCNYHTLGTYSWTLTENENTEGHFCTSAYSAIVGTNNCNHTTGYDQWFKYSPELDGRIEVTNCGLTEENTYLEIYKDCDHIYLLVNNVCRSQESIIFPAYSDQTYFICWTNNYTSSTYDWILNHSPLNFGEECIQSHTAVLGDNSCTHTDDFDQWFSFTAPKTGKIIITSCKKTLFDTNLKLYSDCNTLLEENDDYCNEQSEITYDITEDETIYMRWIGEKVYNKTYTWNLSYDNATIINNSFIKPSSNEFNIDLSSYNDQTVSINVYNIYGQQVFSKTYTGGNSQLIGFKRLVPGIYIIEFRAINNQLITRQKIRIPN